MILNPPIPIAAGGNRFAEVTVGDPLVTVTEIVLSDPIPRGLNGRLLIVPVTIVTSVARTGIESARSTNARKNSFFMEFQKRARFYARDIGKTAQFIAGEFIVRFYRG